MANFVPAGGGASSAAMQQANNTAASFNCTGAVRKAGFLSVKKWILRKKHQVIAPGKGDYGAEN